VTVLFGLGFAFASFAWEKFMSLFTDIMAIRKTDKPRVYVMAVKAFEDNPDDIGLEMLMDRPCMAR